MNGMRVRGVRCAMRATGNDDDDDRAAIRGVPPVRSATRSSYRLSRAFPNDRARDDSLSRARGRGGRRRRRPREATARVRVNDDVVYYEST